MRFSPRGVARDKRLVAVSSDLVSELFEIANKQGKTFQTALTQVVSGGIRILKAGRSVEEVVDFYELMDMQRSSGAALVPVDLCNYMSSRLYETEPEVITSKWNEAGSWFGKFLSSKFPGRESSEMLGKLLLATRWDLREAQFERNESTVRFRCIAPHLPEHSTRLLASFVEGAMTSTGHRAVRSEVIRGMIIQEYVGNATLSPKQKELLAVGSAMA